MDGTINLTIMIHLLDLLLFTQLATYIAGLLQPHTQAINPASVACSTIISTDILGTRLVVLSNTV